MAVLALVTPIHRSFWRIGGRQAGLPVGNHTFDHRNFAHEDADSFIAQVVRNEALVAPLMHGEDWRSLRYPFLSEDDSAAKRDAVRAWLAAHGSPRMATKWPR